EILRRDQRAGDARDVGLGGDCEQPVALHVRGVLEELLVVRERLELDLEVFFLERGEPVAERPLIRVTLRQRRGVRERRGEGRERRGRESRAGVSWSSLRKAGTAW